MSYDIDEYHDNDDVCPKCRSADTLFEDCGFCGGTGRDAVTSRFGHCIECLGRCGWLWCWACKRESMV